MEIAQALFDQHRDRALTYSLAVGSRWTKWVQSLLKSTILQYNVRGWRKLCDRLSPQPRISFVPLEAGKSPVNRTKTGEGLDRRNAATKCC